MADLCQCMAKNTQYCKVISLQLIKINGKKNNITFDSSQEMETAKCPLADG